MKGRDVLLQPAPFPIGVSVPRRDALAKVTGAATFTVDVRLPGMAHAKLLRSPYPHARIRSIDVEAARHGPGVVTIVTAADLPDVELRYGHAVRDHPLIADGIVRFAGEPVAGVVAEDERSAGEAIEAINVDYDPLPFVTDSLAALEPTAPLVHDEPAVRGDHGGFVETIRESAPNVCSRVERAWGDVEAAFAGADLVVDETYEYPMAYAYAMEPYTAVATFEADQLTVWSSAQHAFMVRADLARCFRLPLANVRVVVPYVGGGYGSKSYTKIEPLAAALALRAGRPVRLALSVEESILTTRSVSSRIRLRTAASRDGRLLGRTATIWLNAGAYAENAPRVADKAANRIGGPYRVPAVSVKAITVYTNTAPGSSYRGLGAPQAVFAGESQIDEVAHRLGLDPMELRRRNLLERGERMWPGARGMDADLADDLRIAAGMLDGTAPEAGRGRAIAVSASDAGAEPLSTAIVRVLADGSVVLLSGSAEMGQGSATVLPQIAAAELGVALESVRLIQSDTAHVSYDRSTGASRTTAIMGLAVQRAAADARTQLVAWARELYAADAEALREERGGMRVGERLVTWSDIVQRWFSAGAGEVVGRGYVRRADETAELPLFWEVGVTGLEVGVDRETGVATVERQVTVGDVGRAINPALAEGQDRGAATMGLGVALRESLRYEDGQLVNGNLYEYRLPRTTDLPDTRSALAERGDGVGPYGAKGGGEAGLNPVAPALANAVFAATGVRIRSVPLHPERVWRALRDAKA